MSAITHIFRPIMQGWHNSEMGDGCTELWRTGVLVAEVQLEEVGEYYTVVHAPVALKGVHGPYRTEYEAQRFAEGAVK